MKRLLLITARSVAQQLRSSEAWLQQEESRLLPSFDPRPRDTLQQHTYSDICPLETIYRRHASRNLFGGFCQPARLIISVRHGKTRDQNE